VKAEAPAATVSLIATLDNWTSESRKATAHDAAKSFLVETVGQERAADLITALCN